MCEKLIHIKQNSETNKNQEQRYPDRILKRIKSLQFLVRQTSMDSEKKANEQNFFVPVHLQWAKNTQESWTSFNKTTKPHD